ncbi:hypothetical protein KBI33_01940 [Candidatus Shapirobacteria bacterium]|nr:hypothetical protein [Candidatus Shapirobacteria bacterium]
MSELERRCRFPGVDRGDGKEGGEKKDYYLIPEGTVVWPQKGGEIIDRYRGALTADVLATPLLVAEGEENKRHKRQKRKGELLLWVLAGTAKEMADGSLVVVKNNATLYLDRRYWQIEPGSVIATGSKKENNIKKI